MIFGENVKELEIQSAELSQKILEFTKSEGYNVDELNALKADKKHISDQLRKIHGKKLVEDTDRFNNKKIVFDKKNIDRYNKIKKIVDLESNLTKSIDRLIISLRYASQVSNEKVKIK